MRMLLVLLLPGLLVAADEPGPAAMLFEGEPEVVTEGHQFAEGMAFDGEGNFIFTDVPKSQLFRIDAKSGERTLIDGESGGTNGIAIGPDGMIYGCASRDKKIYRWDPKSGERSTVAEGPRSNDIAVAKDGTIWFTDPKEQLVWRVAAKTRELSKAAELPWNPNGIALNPKQDALFVAEFYSGTVHRLAIAEDGTLGEPKPGFKLATPEDGRGHLDGMLVLPCGWLLSGTARGIQCVPPVGDKSGAKPIVVPPFGERPRCNYVRVSPDGQWLYAAFAKDIVRLRMRQVTK